MTGSSDTADSRSVTVLPPVEELMLMLAAADSAWCHLMGDEPPSPQYFQSLAERLHRIVAGQPALTPEEMQA